MQGKSWGASSAQSKIKHWLAFVASSMSLESHQRGGSSKACTVTAGGAKVKSANVNCS